jgi:hypothetical protein
MPPSLQLHLPFAPTRSADSASASHASSISSQRFRIVVWRHVWTDNCSPHTFSVFKYEHPRLVLLPIRSELALSAPRWVVLPTAGPPASADLPFDGGVFFLPVSGSAEPLTLRHLTETPDPSEPFVPDQPRTFSPPLPCGGRFLRPRAPSITRHPEGPSLSHGLSTAFRISARFAVGLFEPSAR